MSRSGYCEDGSIGMWEWIRYRGAVASAIRGNRGQTLLRDLLDALDSMEDKRLVGESFSCENGVCALGRLAEVRGYDVAPLEEIESGVGSDAAKLFDVAPALAAEIMFTNDEAVGRLGDESADRYRWRRVRSWVAERIRD